VSGRPTYPSDLTDEQWAVVGPFLQAWKDRHPSVSGHQGRYELREIVNAIFYQNRTGCQWAYLPHDLPPKSATYYYFALWRDDGTDQAIHNLLRCQAREKAGRAEDPTAVVLDTQSIRAANHVPAATTGKDVSKKVSGRKRDLAMTADQPDHHQVHQSHQHTVDRYRGPGNPSSPHVRQVLTRYRLQVGSGGLRTAPLIAYFQSRRPDRPLSPAVLFASRPARPSVRSGR
jgi:transposase